MKHWRHLSILQRDTVLAALFFVTFAIDAVTNTHAKGPVPVELLVSAYISAAVALRRVAPGWAAAIAWKGRQKPTSNFSRKVWMKLVSTDASICANKRVVGSSPIGSAVSASQTATR